MRNIGCEFNVYGEYYSFYGNETSTKILLENGSEDSSNCFKSNTDDFLKNILNDRYHMNIPHSIPNSVFYPSPNSSTGSDGYCHISVPGKTCNSLKFDFYDKDGDDIIHYYLQNSLGNTISNSSTTEVISLSPAVSYIHVVCGINTIRYKPVNSTISFNPIKSQLEFTPLDNTDLGCQYHDGNNYMSFVCDADNTGVNAVQYKCGL